MWPSRHSIGHDMSKIKKNLHFFFQPGHHTWHTCLLLLHSAKRQIDLQITKCFIFLVIIRESLFKLRCCVNHLHQGVHPPRSLFLFVHVTLHPTCLKSTYLTSPIQQRVVWVHRFDLMTYTDWWQFICCYLCSKFPKIKLSHFPASNTVLQEMLHLFCWVVKLTFAEFSKKKNQPVIAVTKLWQDSY